MNALSLYSLEENLLALLDTAEMVEDQQQQLAILNEIAQANQAAIEKRDALIRFLKHLDYQCSNIDKEIDRLQRLKQHYQNGSERVQKYAVSVIEEFAPEPKRGPKKLEGTIGVLSLRKNPDRFEILDEKVIPPEYMVTPEAPPARPDKVAIKKALQGGAEVPGADLVFGSNRLEIK